MKRQAQRAALMLSAALPLPILFSGCASTPMPDSAQQISGTRPLVGFSIAQLGYDESSYFGMCLQAACPVVTPKTNALSAQPAAPSDTRQKAPPSQDRFMKPEGFVIHFDAASAELEQSATAALVQLADQARHAAHITVVGRTDSTGSRAFNQRLAWQRARVVGTFLREQLGIAPARITVEGRGACCYVADNTTSDGRRANRHAVVTFHLAQEALP
ncbi:OmpA family protein [Pseudoduganella sp. SL102]|uniref:OmpA family protein n=1 Tax=Pseudoduganella sp. SL102 TaxID=2995154 RepID=UPI00248D2F0D|nr:OmpA family protein [Pseudoduganella sp. SL102]WBS00167.1 OmpA family protein [Pseudoduganella sp. SL102]